MDIPAFIFAFVKALAMVAAIMTVASLAVLAERKVSSFIQGRVGPNRTRLPIIADIPILGPFLTRNGLFQPIADTLKFLFKEEIVPGHVNRFYYVLAPCVALIPAVLTMTVLPVGMMITPEGAQVPVILANLDVGILFILAVSSLGVYGIILAGWSANSKYPFLGGVRSSAQLISYELAMGLSLLPVFLTAGGVAGGSSLSLVTIASMQETWWLIFWQPLSALIFLTALFAETNRLPFDMPEAETELVAGYNTEYGAFKFGMFFVAEYTHIIVGSAVFTCLFLGGWDALPFFDVAGPTGYAGAALSVAVFAIKTLLVIFFFMWIRWTLPRFRYDQVMNLGWKVLLPLSIANLVFYACAIAVWENWSRWFGG